MSEISKRKKSLMRCEVCNEQGASNNKLSGMSLCPKHALQFKRNGKILKNTRFDTNDYTVSECGNFATISLRNVRSEKVGETIVDIDDLHKVIKYRIHMKSSHKNKENALCYAVAKVDGKNVRIHHLIKNSKLVDHINNNGLDNRKLNLRDTTNSKNSMNQRTQHNSKSGVTGVNWGKSNQTWHANIKKNGKITRLSCSQSTFDNAVKTRIKGEARLFKEHSNNYNHRTNTIQLLYQSKDDNINTFIEVDMNGDVLNFHKIA